MVRRDGGCHRDHACVGVRAGAGATRRWTRARIYAAASCRADALERVARRRRSLRHHPEGLGDPDHRVGPRRRSGGEGGSGAVRGRCGTRGDDEPRQPPDSAGDLRDGRLAHGCRRAGHLVIHDARPGRHAAGDAGDSGRRRSRSDVSAGRDRSAESQHDAVAAGAAGVAADGRQPRLPSDAVRAASLCARGHDARHGGQHRSRVDCRVPQDVLPAEQCVPDRHRRRGPGRGVCRGREGVWRVGAR